jgi:hypothetical protein
MTSPLLFACTNDLFLPNAVLCMDPLIGPAHRVRQSRAHHSILISIQQTSKHESCSCSTE